MREIWSKIVGPEGENARGTTALLILCIPLYVLFLTGFTYTRDPFLEFVRGLPTWILLFSMLVTIGACVYIALKLRNVIHL